MCEASFAVAERERTGSSRDWEGSLLARIVLREVLKARGSCRLGSLRLECGDCEVCEVCESEARSESASEEASDFEFLSSLGVLLELDSLLGLGALEEISASESVSARSTASNSSPEGEEEELW